MPYPIQMPGMESLVNTFGDLNPESYNMARQSFNLANQYNQQNLIDQRMATERQAQMNPLEIEAKQLANQGAGLMNEGRVHDNWKAGRDNRIRQGIPEGTEIQSQLSKIATQMSDDQLKQLESGVNAMALSPDPAIRQKGLAMRQNFAEFQKMREKAMLDNKNTMSEIGARGAETRRTDAARIDAEKAAGKYDKSGARRLSAEQLINSLKNPRDRYGALLDAAKAAELDGDMTAAMNYKARADQLERLVKAQLGTAPKAGTAALDKLDIETNPEQEINPTPSAPTSKLSGPQADAWIQKAMKANPGMTREQVIQEGQKRGKL